MHVQSDIAVCVLAAVVYLCHLVVAVDEYHIIEIEPFNRQQLHCYTCYEYELNCQSFTNASVIQSKLCNVEETFCKVRRVHVRDELIVFERSCSAECTPGCEYFLFRSQCVSCCNANKCNTDNAGSAKVLELTLITISGFISTLWTQ